MRVGFRKRRPIGARFFEQAEGAVYVGAHEIVRAVDGAIHVAFSGKVDDGARLIATQQLRTSSRSTISPCSNR